MRHLLSTLLLVTLASACFRGYSSQNNPYSELTDMATALRDASPLATSISLHSTGGSWIHGSDGLLVTETLEGEVELAPAQLDAYLADVDGYLRDDIFAWGFYLDEEGCGVESAATGASLAGSGSLTLAWESVSGEGSLTVDLSPGSRTGLSDLVVTVKEASH